MNKLIQILIVLFSYNVNAQIIDIKPNDSIKLTKQKELKEDNLIFYKNEFSLIIYNKENIKYNKKNGFTYKTFAGGKKYCDKCKKEEYIFNLEKIEALKSNKLEIFNIDDVHNNLRKYQFSYGYFYINNVYYKNLGIPIN